MIRDGFIINTSRFTIERDCKYDDRRREDIYYLVDNKDLIPVAYVYPVENRVAVMLVLEQCAEAKKKYDDVTANAFYKTLPGLRYV